MGDLAEKNRSLAKRVKVTENTISRFRRGTRPPPPAKVRLMAIEMGLPPDYFEEGFDRSAVDLQAIRRARFAQEDATKRPTGASGRPQAVPQRPGATESHDPYVQALLGHLSALRRQIDALEGFLLGQPQAVNLPPGW